MAHQLELPDKLYFKIGEVAQITGLEPHVLRYWETEFKESIRPQKGKNNQRLFRRKDIEAVLAIRHLLYERRFTIAGAKRYLREHGREASLPVPNAAELLDRARQEARRDFDEALGGAKADERRRFERGLLEIKREIATFLKEMEKTERLRGGNPSGT